jgi:predicted metal-dependent phosphoesterase TrpH
VRVVAGCEFSVHAPWGELHLLAYFLPPADPALDGFLAEARGARKRRGAQMVEKLQRLGVEIDLEDLAYQAGDGAVGRPHVARALVDAGVVNDFEEAFARFLGRGRPAFVDKPLPQLREVTDLVHGVRGLVVAAHLGDRGQEPLLRTLQADGLDGIEVRHPSHSKQTQNRLLKLAPISRSLAAPTGMATTTRHARAAGRDGRADGMAGCTGRTQEKAYGATT